MGFLMFQKVLLSTDETRQVSEHLVNPYLMSLTLHFDYLPKAAFVVVIQISQYGTDYVETLVQL